MLLNVYLMHYLEGIITRTMAQGRVSQYIHILFGRTEAIYKVFSYFGAYI